MILYHSSPYAIEKPDIFHSRNNLDFGKGFYLTTHEEQAIKYAERFRLRNKTAYLNIYDLDDNLQGISIKQFDSYDEEWLSFVSLCRKNMDNQMYDIVIGGIANDKVFRTIDLFFAGEISKNEALKKLKFEQPNNQFCIRSQAILDHHLKFIEAKEIK